MKEIFKNGLSFLILLSFMIAFCVVLTRYRWSSDWEKLGNYQTIIFGASGSQTIPEGWFDNARNISQASEPLDLSLLKLEELIKHNPNTAFKIIINCSPVNFSEFNDFKFDHVKWSPTMKLRKSGILDSDIGSFTYRLNFFKPNPAIGNMQKHKDAVIPTDYERKILDRIWRKQYTNPFDKKEVLGFSDKMRNSMDGIIELALKNNLDLVLVDLPVHHAYETMIPKDIQRDFDEYVQNLPQGVDFVSSPEIDFMDDEFKDYVHLNKHGIEKYKDYFLNQLD